MVIKIGTSRLYICKGSAVNFIGDAVVNAANVGGLGGGGIDAAMNKAGGLEFQLAREDLPIINKENHRIKVGDTVHTIAAGSIKAKWVIHAVGPNYNNFDNFDRPDKLLSNVYKNIVTLTQKVFSTHSNIIFQKINNAYNS